MRASFPIAWLALAGLLLGSLLDTSAWAATRTVTNANDTGAGSLRATIAAAATGDTIVFATGLTGPIKLTSGELVIGENLTVTGPANGLTVQLDRSAAIDYHRVFNITSGATVSLSNLTVSDGAIYGDLGLNADEGGDDPDNIDGFPGGDARGGGILNNGTLTLRNCTIRDNGVVGGDGGDSESVIIGCNNIGGVAVGSGGKGGAGQGGGIFNGGTLTLIACTLSGNGARSGATGRSYRPVTSASGGGGGIFNQGALTLSNCTLSANVAAGGNGYGPSYGSKGGPGANGSGGGIFSQGTLTLTNCTFSANVAAGDKGSNGYDVGGNGGDASGGGLLAAAGSPKPTVRNTIVAKNTATGGAGGISTYPGTSNNGLPGTVIGHDVAGAFTSTGYNLIGNGNGSIGFAGTGDQVGVPDPKLGALASNGGLTQTMALLAGSPALDKGASGVTTDQRGVTRPQDDPTIANASGGNGSDSGAYERDVTAQAGPTFTVTTIDEHSDGFCGADCSLWDAANAANANVNTSTITFKAGLNGTITTKLQASGITLTAPVTITGPGASVITVSGANLGRVFNAIADTTISGLTIANGKIDGNGGGLSNGATLKLTNCVVSGNVASDSGGGLHNTGTATLTNCTLSSNSATNFSAGGVFNYGGTLTVTNCTFSGNSSNAGVGGGGAIYNAGGTLTVKNSTFSGNSTFIGGALYTYQGTTTIEHSTITGNTAPAGQGSGVASYADALTHTNVRNTIIAGNTNSDVDVHNGATNSFLSNGYTIVGSGNATGAFNKTGDQAGVTAAQLKLGPLQNNGGLTSTRAPLTGSPALDKGTAGGLTTDQRGKPRPVDAPGIANASGGDGSDIGAVEVQPPFLTINDVSKVEGNSGTSTLGFTVTLAPASSQTVTVNYATANGTAIAGSDYVTKSGTLSFAAGVTTQPVSITINGDTAIEPNETCRVNLSAAANATIADSQGIGTITNDDGAASVSVPAAEAAAESSSELLSGAASVSEGGVTLQFAGELPAEFAVTVNDQTVAIAGVERAGDTVTLLLPDGALHDGDEVVVHWQNRSGLPDRAVGDGAVVGESGPLTAR